MSNSKQLKDFEEFSIVITGFNLSEIQGTGLSETYFNVIVKETGSDYFIGLLKTFNNLDIKDHNHLTEMETICVDEFIASKYSSSISTIILLWYTGQWNGQESYIVSSDSYIEGLVWSAIEAHPMGAKQPGYGSWSFPPQVVSNSTKKSK